MNSGDPIDLLFGGMEKLGPGTNAATLHVLRSLPRDSFHLIVDAGCGSGRQTLVLAQALGSPIHALDLHAPFLNDLMQRAREAGIAHLVHPHCMDMKDIPSTFRDIDLLWSEGAAYSIGFGHALVTWAAAMAPGGVVVASELSWLRDAIPERARRFFAAAYPAMQSVAQNVALARQAGYEVLDTHTLPREAWTEGYYELLAPRAQALLDHEEAAVRDMARETQEEIAVFESSADSYGYVFYVLQRASS
jgi:cyclopropane fatty-acyl-phospholipid synthase-like methyltransferase